MMKIKSIVPILVLALVLLAGCVDENGVWLIKTADPNLAFEVTLPKPSLVPTVTPEAPPVPTIEPEVLPGEETGEVLPNPTPEPPCTIVKGNVSASGEKIFHVPGQANYDRVKIDPTKGEAFFCSEGEAVQAGFRKALR